MRKQPIFAVFLSLGAGIWFQDYFGLEVKWLLSILVFFFIAALVAFYFKRYRAPILVGLFVALGAGIFFLQSSHEVFSFPNEKQDFVFVLKKKLNTTEKNRRYIAEVLYTEQKRQEIPPFKVVLNIPKSEEVWLNFKNRYKTRAYINELKPPDQDYQFDYAKYMSRQEVYHQVFVSEPIFSEPIPLSVANRIRQLRLEIIDKIDHSAISKEAADFMKGIVLADKTEMSRETRDDFSKSGLAHLLAISGTHMAIIFGFVYAFFRLVLPGRLRQTVILLSLIFIWCFAIFIDYGSSVMRSCLMLTTYFMAVFFQRKPDLLHALGLAGVILLALDSRQLFTIGFQLSFLAVFGIYWLHRPIMNLLPRPKNKFQTLFFSVFSVTLSAQIITLPLVIYYFHQFSLISVLANLIVIPAAEIIIISSLILTLIFAFFGEITFLSHFYTVSVDKLLVFVHQAAEIRSILFENLYLHAAEIIALYLLILSLRPLLVRRNLPALYRFTFLVFLFIGVKMFLDYRSFFKEETRMHPFRGEEILSVKRGKELIFFVSEALNEEEFRRYIATPYAGSVRVRHYEIRSLEALKKGGEEKSENP